MTRSALILALVAAPFVVSEASAQSNDHFSRQRREAVANQQALQQHYGQRQQFSGGQYSAGHWGGPTTNRRWYPSTSSTVINQRVEFYPVYPPNYFVPGYGFGWPSPYGMPYYGLPAGQGIHIHREIYHSR